MFDVLACCARIRARSMQAHQKNPSRRSRAGVSKELAWEAVVLEGGFAKALKEGGSKNKILEDHIIAFDDLSFFAPPGNFACMEEDDVVSDFHDGVHIVGIDDRDDIIINRNTADKLINDEGSFGVEAGVGLIAEKVTRVKDNCPGNPDALLHPTADLGRELFIDPFQVDPLKAIIDAVKFFLFRHISKHIQGKADIFFNRHGVEKCRSLEKHTHFHAEGTDGFFVELTKIDIIVINRPCFRAQKAHEQFEQDRFAAAAPADDEVRFSGIKFGCYPFEYMVFLKTFK